MLCPQEVCEGLKDLKGVGIDHVSVDQSGLSGVSYMVFVTGRTPPHMRRMADELVRCLRARGVMLPWGAYPNVEGRDDSDWMLVDASNMFIHIMSETAREALQLEDHWGGMKAGQVWLLLLVVLLLVLFHILMVCLGSTCGSH